MLVLTRRPGEQIIIANNIRVTVVSVGPGRVKLGIVAPDDVRIDRQEIHEKIQHEHAEQASDVLAAVGRSETGDDVSPTIVASSSGDTSATLRSQVAAAMPAPTPATPTGSPTPLSRLLKDRLPRKSR